MNSSDTSKFKINVFEVEDTLETDDLLNAFEEHHSTSESSSSSTPAGNANLVSGNSNNCYHWCFFLASFFIGLAFTALTDHPVGFFLGLGLGFLFFVDPIYKKILRVLS